MIKVLMFDLDGTLLPMDFDMFVRKYFETVAPFFIDIAEPKVLLKNLMASTEKMIRNTGPLTNEKVFMENFLPAINRDKETILPLFDKYYMEEFPKLKQFSDCSPLAAKAVGKGVSRGYRICLATNPVFPRLATGQRMTWAGVDHLPWEFVTTYENSCGCKPNPAYFSGLCRTLGVMPEECLMVGNDVQEDLVAGTLGIKTYLVTDCMIDRGEPRYQPDYRGSLEELCCFIGSLPDINEK